MNSYTSKKLRFNNAEQFKEAFSELESPTIGYVYIGKHVPYANDSEPDIITDTVATEKDVWDNMIAAKQITGNDVQLVVPRINWTINTNYKQFDDTITLDEMLSINEDSNVYPIYVLNSEGNVYKCLSNNDSGISTVEPIGQNLNNKGNILTADQYLWKYLFNVSNTNKFLSNNWIPAPVTTQQLEFSANSVVSVEGELTSIVVIDSGSGYINSSNVQVSAFPQACTTLTLDTSVDIQNTIALNMAVTGNGIVGDTFITSIDEFNRRINLSISTATAGGSSGNLLSISTRVEVLGDGFGAVATATVANTSIEKIRVTNFGSDYSFANVIIYGTATGENVANARAILPPKYGHGYNAAKELGAHNVMIVTRIGEIDSTEGGLISVNTSFRQYGLLRNPHKYDEDETISYANANSVISQTTVVSIIAGPEYDESEFVYQGSLSNPSFSGFVNDQTSNEVFLTGVRGTIALGTVLKGVTTNPTGRTVLNIQYPEFEAYTGDVLYGENIMPIERELEQSENIRFVVKF
jgi:hypothetical protein